MTRIPASARPIIVITAIILVALAASGAAALAVTGLTNSGQGGSTPPGPMPTMTATPPIIASPVPTPTGPDDPVVSSPGGPGSVPESPPPPSGRMTTPPPPASAWPKAPSIPNPGGYDLCGVVASVVPGTADRFGGLLVYGATGVTCDRGLAAVTATTRWSRLNADGSLQAIDPPIVDKALVGMRVAVTYIGAVAESYPVQGTAAVVVLLP